MAELTRGQRGLSGRFAVGIALLAVVMLVLRTTGVSSSRRTSRSSSSFRRSA